MEEGRRKKHKPKARKKNNIVAIILLVVIILALISIDLFYYFFNNPRLIKGTWDRKIDITDIVRDNIEDFISTATFGKDINPSDYISNISVGIELILNQDGSYKVNISEEDYNNGNDLAKEALKSALMDLLKRRLQISAVETESDEEINQLIKDAIGMSIEEYIDGYGPTLMPDIQMLMELYGDEGRYNVNRDVLSLKSNYDGDKDYSYLVSDSLLMISNSDEEYTYTRRDKE